MMRNIQLIVGLLLLFASCITKKQGAIVNTQSSKKPLWVGQRPVNSQQYIGIGRASKISNPADYLQVAKKEALQDLVGEIKVTVSTNSILSQYQNNSNFNQQFFSDTRLIASEFLEGFTVVDSWENKEEYWIYYSLSKADYEAQKRKKIYLATQQALELMDKADKLNPREDFTSQFKLRVKSLSFLQNYLNEAVEAEYKGKSVYLVNEILSQLQDQLFLLRIESNPTEINTSAGKPFNQMLEAFVSFRTLDSSIKQPVPFVPIFAEAGNNKLQGTQKTESNLQGRAALGITRTLGRDPLQFITLRPDVEKLIRGDSLNPSLRSLLLRLESPSASIKIKVEPLRIFMGSKEKNMGKDLNFALIEPALKKRLAENGCTFVSSPEKSDYTIYITASTKDMGPIWGKMLQALLDMELVITQTGTQEEVLHENLNNIQGFQTSKEKAGEEAYKAAITQLMNKVYPNIEAALFIK